jgi:hypothetical protein
MSRTLFWLLSPSGFLRVRNMLDENGEKERIRTVDVCTYLVLIRVTGDKANTVGPDISNELTNEIELFKCVRSLPSYELCVRK